MKKHIVASIWFFLIFLSGVICKITFESPRTEKSSQLDRVPFKEVLVEEDYSIRQNYDFEDVFFSIKALDSSKKAAYQKLLRKHKQLVKILLKVKAIPKQDSLIHSIIHKRFHKKTRKWQFIRHILLYTLKEDTPYIMDEIQHLQPKILKAAPVVKYLSEKKIGIAAFTVAKKKLEEFIKRHMDSEYKILRTKDIQIIGVNQINQEYIESDLQDQFNQGGNDVREGALMSQEESQRFYSQGTSSKKKNTIKIKVLFQLVNKYADIDEILQELDNHESVSDFEEQEESIYDQIEEDENYEEQESDQL